MRPLNLLAMAMVLAYICALKVQARDLFPKPATHATYSVKIDDVIDDTTVQHLTFASKHLCITPGSSVCWDLQPEVEIQ